MTRYRSVLVVFLPFAAGYYLSYLFRMINAVIARPLVYELGIDAGQLGFLTSVYFLTFAAVQLPLGAAIDRFGPRRVQAALLVFAAAGALVFANAAGLWGLLIGRGLIGLGAAAALVAGLKAIADRFPQERLPLVNGAFVAFGAAGAVTATAPLEWLLTHFTWREVFLALAAATVVVALIVLLVAPETATRRRSGTSAPLHVQAIYLDQRFWRLAPLSALCIGSAWALQGLWAAPWLADVALLDRSGIVRHLMAMAMALCVGALLIGIVADRARRRGIGTEAVLIAAACLFIAAELALVCRVPLPSIGLWAIVACMGAGTVLSYALLADLFPREIAGRANAALNVLHIGGAFAIQTAIGLIIGSWQPDAAGQYPALAYKVAFAAIILLQVAALLWFLRPYFIARRAREVSSR